MAYSGVECGERLEEPVGELIGEPTKGHLSLLAHGMLLREHGLVGLGAGLEDAFARVVKVDVVQLLKQQPKVLCSVGNKKKVS
jgi:ribulose-5-phosphate 4-epimerase/fuculose-1-phosphate aldolase